MKFCNVCQAELHLENFYPNERRCKTCKQKANSASYRRNKEEVKLRAIRKKYKLSKEQYYTLLENGCEVCGAVDPLVVDHDHKCCPGSITCGQCIRGALCKRCNIAEGLFKNDPKTIKNLLKYMEKHGIID